MRRPRSLLALAPWRRAPRLIWRHPSVVLAIAGTTLVLALTGAAAPLFVSSAESASLAQQRGTGCSWNYGIRFIGVGRPSGSYDTRFGSHVRDGAATMAERERLVAGTTAAIPHLEPTVRTVHEVFVELIAADGTDAATSLMWREGGTDHVQVLERVDGQGVWVTDTTAKVLGVKAGEMVTLRTPSHAGPLAPPATIRARIAVIYRDLASQPKSDFWCSVEGSIYPKDAFTLFPPLPVLLVPDRATLERLFAALNPPAVFVYERRLVDRPVTVDEAAETAAGIERVIAERDEQGIAGEGPLASAFPRPGWIASTLPFAVTRARSVAAGLRGSVATVSLAGSAIALLLVAAAGGLWVERRRREVALLAARGVGPAGIGVKAALELLGPVLAGGVLGWLAALGLIRLLGPSEVLAASAPGVAATRAALVVPFGLVMLAVVAGTSAARHTERPLGKRRARLAAVPLELALLAASVLAFQRVRDTGIVLAEGAALPGLTSEQLAFPILFLGGSMVLAARGFGWTLERSRERAGRFRPAPFLAARRLASARRTTGVVVTATGLAIGVLVFASALTLTLGYTLDTKAGAFLGSDTSMVLREPVPVPPSLAGRATMVLKVPDASAGDQRVDLLGVDPATFERAATWDRRFSDEDLGTLLARLRRPLASGAVPVVVAGGGFLGSSFEVSDPRTGSITVRVVGRAELFPGYSGRPLVVADSGRLGPLERAARAHLWVRGDPDETTAAVAAAGLPVRWATTVDEVSQTPLLQAVTWTYDYLQALGALVGLIAVGGMLLYLETRQRSRGLAYAMARRMGLSRRSHALSLLAEVGTALGIGLLLGTGGATLAAWLVHPYLDPVPTVPPGPLFRLPLLLLLTTGILVVLTSWLLSSLAQRTADRARPSELMRAG